MLFGCDGSWCYNSWESHPMKEAFEAESTIEQWDADYYHPIALRFYDRAIADMLELMEVDAASTVLDAGCGPGVHAIRVAKSGLRVCAIDISEMMLAHARRRVEAAGIADKVTFCQQDLTKLDFPDNSFRFVFSWGVLIHIPDGEMALDELSRIVEPGGSLALYLSNKFSFDNRIESLARFLFRKPLADLHQVPLGDGCWYEMNGQKLWVCRVDPKALTEQLAKRGFRLKHHRIGELSELQRRLSGLPRRFLLHVNNVAYRLNLSPRFASGGLFVFKKGA